MKRECVDRQGVLSGRQSFTQYCVELAASGWMHGWYYPFLYMENMDDPRSEYTDLKTEADFRARPGLSASLQRVSSLAALRALQPRLALELQTCSVNPARYRGWTGRLWRGFGRLAGHRGR
jgi:hypothetical protein